ncbi:MAG: hypothetical protein NW208_17840 [Bryobacter sp.]|nr:hypothetical protein [Bryobacter sp.]
MPKPVRGAKVLHVAAMDAEGLARENWKATVNGEPAKVLRVAGPEDDLVLLVVLDWSGEPTLIDTAREALVAAVEKLPANHWVGVLKAQDALAAIADPGPAKEVALKAVREYAATGKAGLLPTLEEAAELAHRLLGKSGVRVALLVVTDSNIYNYRQDYTNPVINASDTRDLSRRFPDQLVKEAIGKLSERLLQFESPLYVVHLNYFSDVINEAYQRGLLQLAQEAGGQGVFCRSRGEIATAVERMVGEAARHWSIAVEAGASGKLRTLDVDLYNGERDVANRVRFAAGK